MTSYSGRRAPNVSQYIANLNTIQNGTTEDILGQDDLSLFATTDFFDFDMGDVGAMLPPSDYDIPRNGRKSSPWQDPTKGDFLNNDFEFPDLGNFPSIGTNGNFQAGPYSGQQPTSPTNASSPTSAIPRTGEKRKVNSISGASSELGMDDGARMAAEEDKRRRNTAASARFRIKKKQREQALEKTAKEMTAKASKLETKVQQLEMENKWLKGLITEKNDTKGDFQELYEQFTKERSEDERGSGERTDGVGTSVEEDVDSSTEE